MSVCGNVDGSEEENSEERSRRMRHEYIFICLKFPLQLRLKKALVDAVFPGRRR